MQPFKIFTLYDETITIATDHTIPNNMEKKQSEMNELKSEIIDGIKKAYNLDREAPPVTGTAEDSKAIFEQLLIRAARYGYEYHETTKFPELLFDENCKNNFLQFLQANEVYNSYMSPQSTTIERLTKALESANIKLSVQETQLKCLIEQLTLNNIEPII